MKTRSTSSILLVLLLTFAGLHCRRAHLHPGRVYGKLAIDGGCGYFVVQIDSGYIDPSLMVTSWQTRDTVYRNVFAVKNVCDFAGYGLKQGEAFSFLLNDTSFVENCFLCNITAANIAPLPPVANTVSGVQPLP